MYCKRGGGENCPTEENWSSNWLLLKFIFSISVTLLGLGFLATDTLTCLVDVYIIIIIIINLMLLTLSKKKKEEKNNIPWTHLSYCLSCFIAEIILLVISLKLTTSTLLICVAFPKTHTSSVSTNSSISKQRIQVWKNMREKH